MDGYNIPTDRIGKFEEVEGNDGWKKERRIVVIVYKRAWLRRHAFLTSETFEARPPATSTQGSLW